MLWKLVLILLAIALLMAIILMGYLIYKRSLYPKINWHSRGLRIGIILTLIVLCLYCMGNLFYSNVIYKPILPNPPNPAAYPLPPKPDPANYSDSLLYRGDLFLYNLKLHAYQGAVEKYYQEINELNKPYLNPFIPRH
jgi:amino acid transporter